MVMIFAIRNFSKIKIIPTYDIENDVLKRISIELNKMFSLPVVIAEPMEIPQESYNKIREQYNSTVILRHLKSLIEPNTAILIITDVDLFADGLNFVFGEANILDSVCIISTCRLWFTMSGSKVYYDFFILRIIKEAVHELGHLMGLGHCRNNKCVMYFSNSILDTDRKGKDFCNNCKRRLGLDNS